VHPAPLSSTSGLALRASSAVGSGARRNHVMAVEQRSELRVPRSLPV
jgi:hypothetical protein